jgi:hypothetical protein
MFVTASSGTTKANEEKKREKKRRDAKLRESPVCLGWQVAITT